MYQYSFPMHGLCLPFIGILVPAWIPFTFYSSYPSQTSCNPFPCHSSYASSSWSLFTFRIPRMPRICLPSVIFISRSHRATHFLAIFGSPRSRDLSSLPSIARITRSRWICLPSIVRITRSRWICLPSIARIPRTRGICPASRSPVHRAACRPIT